jgi:hypothetical protein
VNRRGTHRPDTLVRRRRRWTALGVLVLSVSVAEARSVSLDVTDDELKRITDGVLTLMAFTILPDVTTSNLSVNNQPRSDPELWQTTLGGGFTVSREFPLYLEGTLGYSRYDPKFADESADRAIPVKWNSFSATGAIGWDFTLDEQEELFLRPLGYLTLGHVATDAALAGAVIENETGIDVDILDGGRMNAYGLGTGLMLDYERYRSDHEIDVEIRYSHIWLNTLEGTTSGLKGESENHSAAVWARWRAPTGVTLLRRPLRYVLETSHTSFFGAQRGALGFDHLSSVGAGIELDSSAYDIIVTRTRLVGRYIFGDNVSGFSVGLAVSF